MNRLLAWSLAALAAVALVLSATLLAGRGPKRRVEPPTRAREEYAATVLFNDLQSFMKLALGRGLEASQDRVKAVLGEDAFEGEGALVDWANRACVGGYRYVASYSSPGREPSGIRLTMEIDPSALPVGSGKEKLSLQSRELVRAIRDEQTAKSRFMGCEVLLGPAGAGRREVEVLVPWPSGFLNKTPLQHPPAESLAFVQAAKRVRPFLNERVFEGAQVVFAPPVGSADVFPPHLPIGGAQGWLVAGSRVVGRASLGRTGGGTGAKPGIVVRFDEFEGIERIYRKGFEGREGESHFHAGLNARVDRPLHGAALVIRFTESDRAEPGASTSAPAR